MNRMRAVVVALVGLFFGVVAHAENPDASSLRMDQVLAQADEQGAQQAGQADRTRGQRQAAGAGPMQVSGDMPVTSGTAFNPAISVILDTLYSQEFSGEGMDPPGFGDGHGHSHGHGNGHSHGIEDGFQIREVEVVLSGSVDPYFDLMTQFAFSEDGVELEEGYAETTSLPAGFRIKGGKFLSDVGYINRQHTHDWDFTDQPLVTEAMFGEEGLNEVGVQLNWVPPTRMYTRLGVEVLEGDNEGVASVVDDAHGMGLSERSSPRLVTGFAKFGPDLGFDHAALFGVSAGYSDIWQQAEGNEALDGDAWFAGVDAVYKYDAGGSLGHGNWTVQGEYFYRERDVRFIDDGVRGASGKFQQDGLYVQTVYGILPRWNAGLRFDAVGMTNDTFFDGQEESFGTTYRYAGQVSFLPTEFSRLRFQVSHLQPGDEPHGNEILGHDSSWRAELQFTYSLGEHGAHAF